MTVINLEALSQKILMCAACYRCHHRSAFKPACLASVTSQDHPIVPMRQPPHVPARNWDLALL